ncbi:3-hydroxybutyryl-CoA dehydrogenase [Caldalkalibacillus uzonensis]|uniref:3-hydroxybutyryl-CoA dehydrogenase n=1 Tax=Caldalkalibacillus uzonensis TaxID=353224 RepID=A0ABU0CU59_9BACI|nr:3-hydroxyacyl-CoA dehydrogenase NAD-binding domain-containing protein [Caldalkalibacillus uzonensis]MDQ0339951.1 3-hydroxybutyryl-CoA dehydrogenase [Caldalkalibacillus uzonensis]
MAKVVVLGAGTMGAGIAQVVATSGHQVYLKDINQEVVDKGYQGIAERLQRQVQKGKLTESEQGEILARIQPCVQWPDDQFDFIIEAVIEKMEVKKQVFQEMEEVATSQTIIATNTSSLSVTELAAQLTHRERAIGLHFFNPAPIMPLVEMIPTAITSEETLVRSKEFITSLNKKPIQVQDSPGFVVNRLLVPFINEAAFLLMEGTASAEDIDEGMKLGANHPIGPLRLADMIGIDVVLFVMETLFEELGEDKYRPCPLLRQMVRAGKLGRKSGEGFFTYE